MVTTCETKRRFRTCGRPRAGSCQYCGRSFCDEHGGRLDDGQEICSAERCRKKQLDLERHYAYKDAVAARNREQRCGEPQCARAAAGQCSKCQGLFCGNHLAEQQLEERGAMGQIRTRTASLCPHCRRRRALWARV